MNNSLVKFSQDMNPVLVAEEINDLILAGDINPLEVAVGLKKLEKVIEAVFGEKGDKRVKQLRDQETLKYAPKGKALAFGAMVEETVTYTKYDYSLCGHTEYDELAKIARNVKARMDEIEKELQKLSPSSEANPNFCVIKDLPLLTWHQHGEEVSLEPPAKYQSRGTKITV